MKEWDHWTRTGELPSGLPAELYQATGITVSPERAAAADGRA